ncbi:MULTISPECIES: SRPBCC domain-containing protein [Georgenia]|nr:MULTISPECIES: SRPBCC domain-containing protein [Georgenia]
MDEEGTFRVSREIDAPPEEVWRAWSEPDLVRRWWGPTGFSCPRAEVDLREGGSALVSMQAPPQYGGGLTHNRWTYGTVDVPSRLEFVSTFTDADGAYISPLEAGIPPGVPEEVPHVVVLEPLSGGRTRVTVTERGYLGAEAAALSRTGQEQCLERMAALFTRERG